MAATPCSCSKRSRGTSVEVRFSLQRYFRNPVRHLRRYVLTSDSPPNTAHRSPHFHPTVDDDVDTGHVRTFTGGQKQSNVCHFHRSAQTTQKVSYRAYSRPIQDP
jgi:hypothetical protein